MPEILPAHVPSPRTPLVWDGTAYRAVRGHTDGTVQVRGEDQLFSYNRALLTARQVAVSGADGYVDSDTPAAGDIWCPTTVHARDLSNATTGVEMQIRRGAANFEIHAELKAAAIDEWYSLQCHIYLHPNDVVRCYFLGSLVGDICKVTLTGYIMTLET